MSSARSIGQDDDALSSLKRTKRIATAVLAASVFHFGVLTVAQVKQALEAAGFPVRLA